MSTSPMRTPAVQVRGAVVHYGATRALDGVDLDAAAGAVTVVVGGDGAGKTTLLRLLVGRAPLGAGTVQVPDLADIGYLPATLGSWAGLTVAQNVDFVGGSYHVPRERLALRGQDLLVAAGLEDFRDRPAGQLSGGMRRKLGVVLAMLHDPAVLVLDEPTTGVDPVSRVELWRLAAQAAATGTTVVMSTTYLDEAERAGQVLVLDQGRTLVAGTPAEVVAGMRGTLTEAPRPQRPEWAWRRGRVFREAWPDGLAEEIPDGLRVVDPQLEDVVISRALSVANDRGATR